MGIFSSTIADEEYHIPTPDDVDEVREHLICWVPLELANIILDDAKYWPKVNCRAVAPDNEPWFITQDTGPLCCLLTPKLSTLIGFPEGTFWKVRRVDFRITSHDQGWCNQNGFTEKYVGSWTWFEAAIAREVKIDSESQEDESNETEIQRRIREVIHEREEDIADGYQVRTVDKVRTDADHSDVWHIQRNIRALGKSTTHEVVWTEEEDFDGEWRGEEMQFVDATGAGRGDGFVHKLEPNDRIAVIARALYPGWGNYTKEVEVEIYYSV